MIGAKKSKIERRVSVGQSITFMADLDTSKDEKIQNNLMKLDVMSDGHQQTIFYALILVVQCIKYAQTHSLSLFTQSLMHWTDIYWVLWAIDFYNGFGGFYIFWLVCWRAVVIVF